MDISSMTPSKQVKLQYWLNIIHECRTSGLANQAWCEQNGIHLKSYYYWLARIRKMALLPRKNNGAGFPASSEPFIMTQASGDFVEVPLPVSCYPSGNPAAILRIGNISVELFDQTSPGLLVSILKAVQSCVKCQHTTFAEVHPFAAPKAQKTDRLVKNILHTSAQLSSLNASKLLKSGHITVCKSSICSLLKKNASNCG